MEPFNPPIEFLAQDATERWGLWFRKAKEGDTVGRC
jgi:hypothetical protein